MVGRPRVPRVRPLIAGAGRAALRYAGDRNMPRLQLQLERARIVYGGLIEARNHKPPLGYPIPIAELARLLEELGVARGDLLHVHSSVGHLYRGWPEKTPDRSLGLARYAGRVIDVLFDLIGPEGTLVMNTDGVRRKDVRRAWAGQVPIDEAMFDYARTPSRRGLISDLFRRRPDVIRSVHPWYNMSAAGPLAEELLKDDHRSTPYAMDEHSSSYKLTMAGGKMLLLGPGFGANSPLHLVEYVHPDEFPRPVFLNKPTRMTFVDRDRQVKAIEVMLHADNWYPGPEVGRRFCDYLDAKYGLYRRRDLRNGAEIICFDARAQYDATYEEMRAGVTLYDPEFS